MKKRRTRQHIIEGLGINHNLSLLKQPFMIYKNNKNMSSPPRIISEVPVTYGEMIEVLTKLGYHQEFDGKNNRYVNEKHDSWVLLPVKSPDEILEKAYVAIYSSNLYSHGVIKEEESLIYMIQKNRLKKGKKETNSKQVTA